MTQYKYTIGATPQSLVGNLTWNANGTLRQLAVTDPFNATNTQTCNYTHDDLARIASGNCGSVWSQTFTYDAFGNITKAGTNSFNPGYNPISNRMISGATYDSNGDVLTDSLHSYAWDVETRPTTIDTVTATYDALGRMVEQTKAGTSTEIQYSPTGLKMQTLNGQTVKNSFIPLPGGTVLVPQCACYFHGDWLGGSRFASRYSDRTMYNDLAYAPFGEQYAQAGNTTVGNVSFAGNREDTTTNLYDAQHREYEVYGRWPSPDPAGVAAANPANPQSWNRYAYVMNNPLALVDPNGTDPECIAGQAFDVESSYSDGQLVWTGYTPLGSCPGGGGGPGGGHQPGGGGGDCLVAPCGPPKPTPQPNWKNCLNALGENSSEAYSPALLRATEASDAIDIASEATGVDPSIIAAQGIHESGFQDIVGDYGHGHGVYQFDDRYNPADVIANSGDIFFSTFHAAEQLANSFDQYVGINPELAIAGALRNYNGSRLHIPTSSILESAGPMSVNTVLNLGTANNNYVSSILAIANNCFH